MELLTVLIWMIITFGIWHVLVMAGFPPNPLAAVWGFLTGGLKAIKHFMFGMSVLAILGFILFILSLDIVTPPWILGTESLLAIPLGMFIGKITGLSAGWSYGIAYGVVFVAAILYIIIYLRVLRKK